jgi:hypothetical protein
MRFFVTFVNGWAEEKNMEEAIQAAKSNDMALEIVVIDETKLPDDVRAEECVYCAEDDAITRICSW